MRISKYLRFTIEGDNLNPLEIAESVDLPCEVFIKDEKSFIRFGPEEVIQKTNRWVYKAQIDGQISTSSFLKQQLEILAMKESMLEPFIKNFHSTIEIVLYAGNKTNITLTKQHIKLLNKLRVKFSIAFC